jgi:flagellar protein FlaG
MNRASSYEKKDPEMLIGISSTTLLGSAGPSSGSRTHFPAAQTAPLRGAHDVQETKDQDAAAAHAPVAIQQAVADANRALAENSRQLAFSVDEATGKTVVRVVEQSTGRVVRQIPSAEALVIAARLTDGSLASLGLDTQA